MRGIRFRRIERETLEYDIYTIRRIQNEKSKSRAVSPS